MDLRLDDLEQLYRSRYLKFVNVLASVTGSLESGHDATQEAFARAVASRESFRGEGTLESWVWSIGVRVALEHRRAGSREQQVEIAGAAFVEPERDPELAAAVSRLSPRRRLFVFLRYFADLSYGEIAAATGASEGTVAAALAQSRTVLRNELMKQGVLR